MNKFSIFLNTHLLALVLCLWTSLFSVPAIAGSDEAEAAHKKGDYLTAFKEYKSLAEHGDADAQHRLGLMYANGQGVTQDYKEAARLHALAASNGNGMSAYILSGMYEEGKGVTRNFGESLKYYKLASTLGVWVAQSKLGRMYENGEGVAQDIKQAIRYYKLAAAQDDIWSQTSLGFIYLTGKGVTQDYKEAAKFFSLATAYDYEIAQYYLGTMYYEGKGVVQDYREAARLLSLAAEKGVADAQSILGGMYYKGHGVVQNNLIAYALLNLSSSNKPSNSNNVISMRSFLAERMSNSEIETAQSLTRELAQPGNLLKVLQKYNEYQTNGSQLTHKNADQKGVAVQKETKFVDLNPDDYDIKPTSDFFNSKPEQELSRSPKSEHKADLIGRFILWGLLIGGVSGYFFMRKDYGAVTQRSQENPLIGVHGNLLFLVICFGIFAPFISITNVFRFLYEMDKALPPELKNQEWAYYKVISWIFTGITNGFNIFIALKMRFAWNESTITLAKIALFVNPIAVALFYLFIPAVSFRSEPPFDATYFQSFASSLIISIIGSAIWLVYLNRSKQVQATYLT